MKAVIFAAGLGTRLRPLTDTVPKPLLDVVGKPILGRTLEALPASISEAIIVIGYKGGMIREHLRRSQPPVPVRFVEQPELRGTYDALLRARALLDAGPFLVLNGDDLYAREDVERLVAAKPFAMLMHRVPAPNPYSHLGSENGSLTRIVLNKDAAASGLAAHDVYAGAALLDERFFELVPALLPNGESGLPQTLAAHCAAFPVRLIESEFWVPVGTPEELEAARRAFGN